MSEWKIVKSATSRDGQVVELRYREFGKGRTLARKWEIYRDGVKVSYAVNASDAEENFRWALGDYDAAAPN